MIKLCYKEYDWKLSNGACKYFFEKTGKDLNGFFASYIVASLNLPKNISVFERMEIFRSLHSRDDASKAFYCVIDASKDGISLAEIEDATFRVGWMLNDRPDDLSEPWPLEMLRLSFDINDYMSNNIPKKKADT